MQGGRLRHRVTVQEPVESQADDGQVTVTWSKIGVRWAAVEPVRGREIIANEQLIGEVSHKVTLRYMKTLTARHRFLYRDRVLEIVQMINPGEQNLLLECLCKEVV